MPFKKQRHYWRRHDNTYVERNPAVLGGGLFLIFATAALWEGV